MDKKRLKAALVVLDAVKSGFPEAKEFIDNTLKEKCKKEKITADEVIFLKFRSIELARENIFVLNLYYSDYFLLQLWKGAADSKKTKRLSKNEIKKQLLNSIIINEVVESEELNKEEEEIQEPEEAAKIIQQYELKRRRKES